MLNQNSTIVYRATDGAGPTKFTYPVNVERLASAVAWQVAEPETGRQKTVEILQPDEVTYRQATITGWGYGGVIRAEFLNDAEGEEYKIDGSFERPMLLTHGDLNSANINSTNFI